MAVCKGCDEVHTTVSEALECALGHARDGGAEEDDNT